MPIGLAGTGGKQRLHFMTSYQKIQPSGSDTGADQNLARRIKLIQDYVELKDKHILDCGCGRGKYVLKLLQQSAHVYGVEYDPEKVRAYKKLKNHSDHVVQGNIERLTFEDARFDLVLLNEVLEHVSDEEAVLKEIFRVLKPGGHLVLFSPNRCYPFETHSVSLKTSGKSIPYYIPFIPYIPLWLGNHFLIYHARNYFPWEMKKKVRQRGFNLIAQTFLWQTFENISGSSPRLIQKTAPILRKISYCLERIPILKWAGVSQVIIAQKPSES